MFRIIHLRNCNKFAWMRCLEYPRSDCYQLSIIQNALKIQIATQMLRKLMVTLLPFIQAQFSIFHRLFLEHISLEEISSDSADEVGRKKDKQKGKSKDDKKHPKGSENSVEEQFH